ncbi:hypothetical protein NX801_01765 [Streptomyces sp. LP05-1]|uniref:DUF5709 domain-containing protein n=1 Tax=Streptomyces pyxinae TaxID=2970734 RepID=A0ABT2CCB8_9ACTN|nr:hypothetical protein [Streptomyces sp. LP05-1]MCS0634411.1 hypothetical protein [Streptomyces sp. LP05-1]
MTVDPTDPETFEELPEEAAAPESVGGAGLDGETPEADAAEQLAELRPRSDDPLSELRVDQANEADAVEQARVVAPDDDDDYR